MRESIGISVLGFTLANYQITTDMHGKSMSQYIVKCFTSMFKIDVDSIFKWSISMGM